MMERIAASSPRFKARSTGVVYLLYFLTAICAQVLVGRGLAGYSDAANVIANACYATLVVFFYFMFKPVNKSLSLLAALFGFAGCVVATLSLFDVAPFNINPLLFFGPYCLLIGYLIFKSTFLPRVLGVLMVCAGFGWLAFLSPPIADYLSLYIEILGILAEGSLMVWLLLIGVNVVEWEKKTNRFAS